MYASFFGGIHDLFDDIISNYCFWFLLLTRLMDAKVKKMSQEGGRTRVVQIL